jgi:hypothetical protein
VLSLAALLGEVFPDRAGPPKLSVKSGSLIETSVPAPVTPFAWSSIPRR